MSSTIYNIHLLNNKNINLENLKTSFDLVFLKNGFQLPPSKGKIPKHFTKTEIIVFYNPISKWICVYYDCLGNTNDIIKNIADTFKTTAIHTAILDNENLQMFLSDSTGKSNMLNAGRILEDVEFDENSDLDFDENNLSFTDEISDFKNNITFDVWNKILNKNNTFDELETLLKEEYIFYDDLFYEICDLIGFDTFISNCDYNNSDEIFNNVEHISNYQVLKLTYISS